MSVDRLLKMLEANYGGTERRDAERLIVMVPTEVIPLDVDFERVSEPKPSIVRDISELGVAVWMYEEIDAPFMLVKFGETYDNIELTFTLDRVVSIMSSTKGMFSCAGTFVKMY